ncbi:N-acetylmuramoyl-L-alanine amidase [Paenibacillus marinisediminis]
MLFVMLFCFVLPQTGQAAPQPTLYLNGSSIMLPEPIKMINNSVMIPIRVVSEELGYKVGWEQKTRTVTINNGSTSIKLVIGEKTALVNGKEVKLPVAATVINGTTLVPLRFVGESMGLVVDWDNESKSVYLFTSDGGSSEVPPPSGGGGATNDAKVTDFDFFDNTLHIATDKSVKPHIMKMSDPDRIVIDLPNTVFSDEFKSKFSFDDSGQGVMKITDYPDVQRIRYAMFSDNPNTVRFVIDANYPLTYENISTTNGLISLTLNPAPTEPTKPPEPTKPVKPAGKYTVVIDAGHGDHDSGAVSVRKRYEKTANLGIALKVAELAKNEPKLNIVLTRSTDEFLELSERVKIANNLNADLFVSIHHNSIDNKPSVGGTETYYNRADSKAFAETMHKYLMKGTQLKDRGVKYGDHHVTRNTKMPAILLEVGFLTNPDEEAKIFDEDFQWRVAMLTACGSKETANNGSSIDNVEPPKVEANKPEQQPAEVDKPADTKPTPPSNETEKPEKKKQTISVYVSDDELMEVTSFTKDIEYSNDTEKIDAALSSLKTADSSKYIALWENIEFKSHKLDDKGVLTLDIHIPDDAHYGAGGESFAIQALTKTLFQFPEVKAINILIDGKETESLMGHVSLDHPIARP